MQENELNMFYTAQDVQKIFSCSENTLKKILEIKGFPVIKIGKTRYIPKENFRKWINQNLGTEILL